MMSSIQNRTAFQYGLLAGVLSAGYILMLYTFDTAKLASFLWTIFSLVLIIVFMVLAGIQYRKSIGGYIHFKEALQCVFIVFVVATFLGSCFTYLLYVQIDPDLNIFIKEQSIENTISIMERIGAPQDQIDKVVTELEKQDFTHTIGTTALNFAFSCIFGFIISLVLAAILKKEKLVFTED